MFVKTKVYFLFTMLTSEQKRVVEACLTNQNIFVTGAAGTGKSFLLRYVVEQLEERKKRVVVTATTGVAAILIEGRTFASFTNMKSIYDRGYPKFDDQKTYEYWKSKWNDVDVLIVDEISMLLPTDLQYLCRLIKDLDIHVQCIFFGDFYQIPPVCREPSEIRFCFEVPQWKQLIKKSFELKQVVRQQNDHKFIKYLNGIRTGQLDSHDLADLNRRYIKHEDYHNDRPVYEHQHEYTWMFAKNNDVDDHNYKILSKMTGDVHQYEASFVYAQAKRKRSRFGGPTQYEYYTATTVERFSNGESCLDRKFLQNIHFLQDEWLHLRKGGRVLLTVNLDVASGLVNGAAGYIVDFAVPHGVDHQIKTPIVQFGNQCVHIEHHEWKHIVRREPFGYVSKIQIPLRHAYATSIHRSQGQTLQNVVVSTKNIFEDGQLYVALSRVQSMNSLHLLEEIHSVQRKHTKRVDEFYKTL